jgi:hypothetical protein
LIYAIIRNGKYNTATAPPPKISILPNLWVIIPIIALVVAILSANSLLLNYIHVFTAILWTGTDIFMAFLLGPVLRNVSLSTRKEVISWLMPKMVFYMPTVAAVTTTAGYFLASKMDLITLNPPVVYWISVVLVIVSIIQAAMQFVIIFIMAEFATGFF